MKHLCDMSDRKSHFSLGISHNKIFTVKMHITSIKISRVNHARLFISINSSFALNLTKNDSICMNVYTIHVCESSHGIVPEHWAVCWIDNRGVVTLGGGGLCGEGIRHRV